MRKRTQACKLIQKNWVILLAELLTEKDCVFQLLWRELFEISSQSCPCPVWSPPPGEELLCKLITSSQRQPWLFHVCYGKGNVGKHSHEAIDYFYQKTSRVSYWEYLSCIDSENQKTLLFRDCHFVVFRTKWKIDTHMHINTHLCPSHQKKKSVVLKITTNRERITRPFTRHLILSF